MKRVKPLPWPSWKAFRMVVRFALSVAPGPALSALGVLASGKRVRAWNRLCNLAHQHPYHYLYWTEHVAGQRKKQFVGEAAPLAGLAVCRVADESDETLDEVLGRLERRGQKWVAFCDAGDRLDSDLPSVLEAALQRFPETAIFYWDEDWLSPNGHLTPWIKPDWSGRLHMARNCLTGASAIRVADARAALSVHEPVPADRFGIAILEQAICAIGPCPRHLPLVLTRRSDPEREIAHWFRVAPRIWPGWRFTGSVGGIGFLCVTPPDPAAWPSVSIVIPTRDRIDLVRTCLAGLALTDYPGQIEVFIVDNGSTEKESLAYFSEIQAGGAAQVLRDDGPFNFSALNNLAASRATGEFLCLFNNDVEAIDSEWLTAMVRFAVQPDVGAVGARLLYPDGTIQHAGVAIGVGNAAGHIQRGVDPSSIVHAGWHAVTREVTAVTAACLLVSKAHYDAVNGLDEAGFGVAFNDVDLCLKLDAMGLTNIYCAQARLIHAESRSRPLDMRPDQAVRFGRELALLQSRWSTGGYRDPRFSMNFSPSSEQCLLEMA